MWYYLKGGEKMPKKKNLADILTIKNVLADTADLRIYGDIVSSEWDVWDDEVTPAHILDYLSDVGDRDINLYINSGGGSVFGGTQIYTMLQRHKGAVNVFNDGLMASISSVIGLAGDTLTMPENTYMMIHKPLFGSTAGNATELRKQAEILDRIEEGMHTVYKSRLKDESKMPEIIQMLEDETWLTARQVEELFTNVIVTPANRAVAKVPSQGIVAQFNKLPDNVEIVDEIEEPTVKAKGDEVMTIEEIRNAIIKGELKADELKALVLGQDEAVAKLDTLKVIEALGEYKSVKAVEELLAKAEHGNAYMTDLIEQAKSARVKAQGDDFTEEQAGRYVAMLARSNDIDFVKDEIASFEALAQKQLQGGRQIDEELDNQQQDDVIVSVLTSKGVE